MADVRHVHTTWVLGVLLILLLPLLATIYIQGQRQSDRLQQVQAEVAWAAHDTAIASCRRGNMIRANERAIKSALLVLDNPELAPYLDKIRLSPLVPCEQTVPEPSLPRPKEDT